MLFAGRAPAPGRPASEALRYWAAVATDGSRVWRIVDDLGLYTDRFLEAFLQPTNGGVEIAVHTSDDAGFKYSVSVDTGGGVPVQGGPLVTLEVTDAEEKGLPVWIVETPGYPALHESGSKVAVSWMEWGAAPSTTVSVLDTAHSSFISNERALVADELSKASRIGDASARERALASLAGTVRERLRKLNRDINAQSWKTLSPCADLTPTPAEAFERRAEQQGSCGELTYRYQAASVTVTKAGRSVTRKFPSLEARTRRDSQQRKATLDVLNMTYVDESESLLLFNTEYGAPDAYPLYVPEGWGVLRAP
jgi:hypothetical protein